MAWRPKFRWMGGQEWSNRWGDLGTITKVTGHYTAGPRDTSVASCRTLFRSYHRQHYREGWGGIGYHYGIGLNGDLWMLRPVGWKGAHTAKTNTGNVGIVMHGQPGDRATDAQLRTIRWLLANAHTSAVPARYRTSRSLAKIRVYGHNDFTPTRCPDTFKIAYTSRGARSR